MIPARSNCADDSRVTIVAAVVVVVVIAAILPRWRGPRVRKSSDLPASVAAGVAGAGGEEPEDDAGGEQAGREQPVRRRLPRGAGSDFTERIEGPLVDRQVPRALAVVDRRSPVREERLGAGEADA